MQDFKIKYHSPGRIKISSEDESLLKKLYSAFTYQRKVFGTYRSINTFNGLGLYSCISPAYTAKIGLTLEFAKWIRDNGYTVKIDNALKEYIQPNTTWVKKDELILPQADFTYRDYQEKAIRKVKQFGNGILESPTSSGKSLILYGICSNIKEYSKRTLIIVPRIQLVKQFYNEWVKEYGFKSIAMFSTQCPELNNSAKVIITNYQFLVKGNKADILIQRGNFNAVIMDECHTIGESSSWISKFLFKLNTKYRLGCTGTIPEEKSRMWNLFGTFGPVIFKEDIFTLQERNIISNLQIKLYQFKHNLRNPNELPWIRNIDGKMLDKTTLKIMDTTQMYRAEMNYIEHHNFCNNYILNYLNDLQGNTVVLVDHIEHADYLYNNCQLLNKFLITGKTKLDSRIETSTLIDTDKTSNYVIFAIGSAFGTGTSIKNLQNLIICSHGKGITKIIQSIGRILRKTKKDGEKEYATLIDFSHNQLFSKKHLKKRIKLYNAFYKKELNSEVKSIVVPTDKQNELYSPERILDI